MKSYLNRLVARARPVAPHTSAWTSVSPTPDLFVATAPMSSTPQPLAAPTHQIEVSSDLPPAKDGATKFSAPRSQTVFPPQNRNLPAAEPEVAPEITRSNPEALPESAGGASLRAQPVTGPVAESRRAKQSQLSKAAERVSKVLDRKSVV